MPLSSDPVKRGRQFAHMEQLQKKPLTGLATNTAQYHPKIKIKLNRTLMREDRSVVATGETVLNDLELVKPLFTSNEYSVKNWFEKQPSKVQESLAKTLGRDVNVMEMLIKSGSERKKRTWVYQNPIPLGNSYGNVTVDDRFSSNYVKHSYEDKIKVLLMSPKTFLDLTKKMKMGEEDKKIMSGIKNTLIRGDSLSTPFINVNEDVSAVIGSEGKHRAESALETGINLIPVYVITKKPISKLSRLEMRRLLSANLRKEGTT